MAARLRRRVRWFGTVGPALTLADAAAVGVAALLAGSPAEPLLWATAAAVLVARAADLHRPRLVLSVIEDLPGLLLAATSATVILVAKDATSGWAGPLLLALLLLAHTSSYAVTRVLRDAGRLRRRVLVVGTGGTARQLAWTLLTRPELGLRPVGFVGTGALDPLDQARGLPLALVGQVPNLPRAMTEARVDAVVVALSGPAGDAEKAAVGALLAAPGDVYAVPSWFPPVRAYARHPRELLGDIPVVQVHGHGAALPVRVLKRLVEALAAALTLLVLLPLFALLAVLVLVETGGVLVRRPRLDETGRTVLAPRFRTRRSRSVVRPGTTFSVAISGRMGPIGRLLRWSGLVALPELAWALAGRVRHPGSVPGDVPMTSTAAPSADQAQVDAGQLTR